MIFLRAWSERRRAPEVASMALDAKTKEKWPWLAMEEEEERLLP